MCKQCKSGRFVHPFVSKVLFYRGSNPYKRCFALQIICTYSEWILARMSSSPAPISFTMGRGTYQEEGPHWPGVHGLLSPTDSHIGPTNQSTGGIYGFMEVYGVRHTASTNIPHFAHVWVHVHRPHKVFSETEPTNMLEIMVS